MKVELSDILTLEQAADVACMSYRTATRKIAEGEFPEPIQIGKHNFWLKPDVAEYKQHRKRIAFIKRYKLYELEHLLDR